MKRLHPIIWLMLVTGIVLGPSFAQTNTISTSSQEAFELYRCETAENGTSVVLSAYITDANGNSAVQNINNVAIEAVGYETSAPPSLESTTSARRNPVRIILVLDTTSTMPILEVINTLSTRLAPQLDFNDEVALITFTKDVTPITQFYTDKNRLINENILNLQVTGGQNRLYDAIYEAVGQYDIPKDGIRDTILVITDSNRRDVPQSSISDIIARANPKKIQIYNIGIYTEDKPDETELKSLSERTNGFAWIYNNVEDPKSKTALEDALTTIFDQFIQTLNQEVRLTVNLSTLNLTNADEITLKTTVSLKGGSVLTDTVNCPIPQPISAPQSTTIPNTIAFTNPSDPLTTTQPIQIGVSVQTNLPAEEQLITFLQNGEIVQSSSNVSYTFNTPTLPPGTYSITAQLRNLDNTVFATTDSALTINAQQVLQLNVLEGALDKLDGAIRIEALSNPSLSLPDVRFTVGRQSDPSINYPFGTGYATVQNGHSVLTIPNFRAELERLFPNIVDGETLEIRAAIPSISPNVAVLAQSDALSVVYKLPPPPPFDVNLVLVAGLSLALLLLNIILFFRVKRARIRRMIYKADNYDLPNRLMAVTVYRDTVKHTHALTKKTITVGRGGSNDINLGDDNKVSRQHGVIMWRKQEWYYANRKGDAFVRIGGKRYRGFRLVLLEPVTEIEIGDARVFFHSNSQQDISELTKTNL